jgi:hypothetical protein
VQVHEEALDADLLEQLLDRPGEVLEGVVVLGDGRRRGKPETREVGRDDVRDVGQRRHDLAERVRRAGESVQQQHRRRATAPSLAEEHLQAVDIRLSMTDLLDRLHRGTLPAYVERW